MHFFIHTDNNNINAQVVADAFGTESSDPTNKFNITSRFQLTGQTKAFACQKGLIIVQQSSVDSTLVNVILKPIEGLKIPFNSVKYFVYRGLLKSSFISGTVVAPEASGNSEFIARFWDDWNSYKTNTNQPTLPDPTPQSFGYDNSLAGTLNIENIYDNSQTDVKALIVKEGELIGDFGNTGKIGFEIITEDDNLNLDLDFLRAEKFQIDVTGLTGLELKARREQILSFIDPAAFFGLHYDIGVNITLYSESNKIVQNKKQDDLYTVLLNKFATKNRVYLDVRSEKGYSYNFYQNYDDGSSNNIKLGNSETSPIEQVYGYNEWPIVVIDTPLETIANKNDVKMNLRIDDNIKPILFLENTDLLGENNNSRFLNENILLNGTAIDWSKNLIFKFPNTGTGSAKDNIAYYIKLQYFRQVFNSASPNTVLKNENYFDSAFCPIDLSNLADNNYTFQQVHNPDLNFVRGQLQGITNEFGYVADSGAFWDNDRILFYSQAVFQNKRTEQFYSKDKGIENKISLDSKYFELSFLTNDVNINCKILQEEIGINQYTPFKSIAISDYNRFLAAKENLLLLGIKKDELQSLIDAANAVDQNTQLPKLSDKHHRYLFLEEDLPTPKTDKDGILFRKFKLKVQGLTPSGESAIIAPNNDIFLYMRDGLCFTSKDFAEYETVSTISNACRGDRGKAILEINIRLAGFGCLLPTEDFTEMTENGVKQFQRDYMNIDNPTGVADIATLKKIDEFCEIYRENVANYKCKCGTCGGFGKGQFKNQFSETPRLEMYHKYEYPGIHQSLLWAVSASRFYFTKKLNGEYSIRTIYAGYRCWVDNNNHGRNSTNHMGKAVDIHFNKNGVRFTSDMDLLREKIYCECIGAPKQGGNPNYRFGWLPDRFGLEPNNWADGETAANTWVHLDVREFDRVKFLEDEFFIKYNNGMNFSKKIIEINN